MNAKDTSALIEKLQSLPPQCHAQVAHFVDSLRSRDDDQHLGSAARTHLEQQYDKLKRSPKTGPLVAVIKRFVEIDGLTLSGLVSIQLFTIVIPLIIIGFAYFSGFASNASVGDLFIRDLGLHHPFDDRVREAFGTPSGVQYVWTFLGLAPFLACGIPMSIKVATLFAQAWRRQQFGMAEKLGRGAAWFVLYLGIMT